MTASPVSSLNPYQFAFTPYGASSNFIFGAGTAYAVTNVDGLAGLPDIRNQDDDRGYTDGSYSGRDFYSGRTVTIDITILGNSTYSAQYYYNLLQTSLYPQQIGTPSQLGVFQFELASSIGLKIMYGRVRKITTSVDPEYTFGYITTSVEFFFPDPRYYDYPYETATATSSSPAALSNNGWAVSCPVITVNNTYGSFQITDSNGNYMSFNGTAGTTVVIDLLQKTITQNGNYNRNIFSTSNNGWLYIPPVTPSSAGFTFAINAGTMSISYTDAYV
jgi:hypothetical protein